MRERLVDRIPFAKILVVLAVTFGVSLGLCGVTLVMSAASHSGDGLLEGLGILELAAMALSAGGLILASLVWLILRVIGGSGGKVSQPQKLLDEEDDTKLDKHQ
jgi:hypothetical protein